MTCLRLFFWAKSNAKRAIRSDFARVTILRASTTPGTDWCSKPEYSPSVFSYAVRRIKEGRIPE